MLSSEAQPVEKKHFGLRYDYSVHLDVDYNRPVVPGVTVRTGCVAAVCGVVRKALRQEHKHRCSDREVWRSVTLFCETQTLTIVNRAGS